MFEPVDILRRAVEAKLLSYSGITARFYHDPHVNTPTLEVHDSASGGRLLRAVYRYFQENDTWLYGVREEPFPTHDGDLQRTFWFRYVPEPQDPACRGDGTTADAIEWTTERIRGRLSAYAIADPGDQIGALKKAYVGLSREQKGHFLEWIRAQALDGDIS